MSMLCKARTDHRGTTDGEQGFAGTFAFLDPPLAFFFFFFLSFF